jgi:hypothetical protein
MILREATLTYKKRRREVFLVLVGVYLQVG